MTEKWMQALSALIDKAEAEGKWLFCSYQQLWFSPAELRAHNANDRFCWGVPNWQLRDPGERLAEADRAVADAKRQRDAIAAGLGK
jgi:hypothetical protein